MKKYLITIDADYEKDLLKYGIIEYKSDLLQGFYIINSLYPKSVLEELHFVKRVENDTRGILNV